MLLNVNSFLWIDDVDVREDGVIDEDVVMAFTAGHCHAFALALHRALGWELVGALWEWFEVDEVDWDDAAECGCWPDFEGEDGFNLPGHCLVRDDEGVLWDITGPLPKGDACYRDAKPIDPAWVEDTHLNGFYRPCQAAFAATFVDEWRNRWL